MYLDDALELKHQFGLSAADLGITDDFMFSYQAKGKFFGFDCDCFLFFDFDKVFTDYSIQVYGNNNGMLIDILNDTYSGPLSSSMTPYAASNGGAVYSYVFEDPEALLTVSLSQSNSLKISIKPNQNPGYFGSLCVKTAEFKGFFPEKLEVFPLSFSKGILTVKLNNHSDHVYDISDEFALYEMREASYYSKFRLSLSLKPSLSIRLLPEESTEINLDLRSFGKPAPNKYMVKFSGIELYFILEDEASSQSD